MFKPNVVVCSETSVCVALNQVPDVDVDIIFDASLVYALKTTL